MLPLALMNLWQRPQQTTKLSPCEILVRRPMRLPRTDVPTHESLLAGDKNITPVYFPGSEIIKMQSGPGTAYTTSTSRRGSAPLQSKELSLGKSMQKENNLPCRWEGPFLISLTFLSSKGGRKIEFEPRLPSEICDQSL